MSALPLEMYDDALRHGGRLQLRWSQAVATPFDLQRWCAPADAADGEVLRRCTGPTLDVGCGPGRLVAELVARGVRALGVDVSPAAVTLARTSGGRVLRRDVFGPLPHEGHWREVLLIDGNVGIGGDPAALLARVSSLLAPGGRLLAEVEPGDVDQAALAVLEDAQGALSRPFGWARLGTAALARHAAPAALFPVEGWSAGGREFVALERRGRIRRIRVDLYKRPAPLLVGARVRRPRRPGAASDRGAVGRG